MCCESKGGYVMQLNKKMSPHHKLRLILQMPSSISRPSWAISPLQRTPRIRFGSLRAEMIVVDRNAAISSAVKPKSVVHFSSKKGIV